MGDLKHYFFCGIGGSGMMPLALIAQALGHKVSGSDRSRDQGKLPEKFAWLEDQGITLYPQDGEGLTSEVSNLVISTAVEDHIPDIKAAKERGISILHRSELLADFFNNAKTKIAIAGTSGKTTVTGMTGYLLKELGFDPLVMNGGVFKNYAQENPYCTALTGAGDVFVTEADESDGSIARYQPDIAVLNNIALDHKSLEELLDLFEDIVKRSKQVVINIDNSYCRDLARKYPEKCLTFSLEQKEADLCAARMNVKLSVIGAHNTSNALAALSVAKLLGIDLDFAVNKIYGFKGIKRRLDLIGEVRGGAVIDDFAHNPDKISASLKAIKNHYSGRLVVFFQPHGFALLKQLHKELAESFDSYLKKEDRLYLVDPYYAGGTVDRSVTSKDLISEIRSTTAILCNSREEVKAKILAGAREGDVIVVMGARDDTLSAFAQKLYNSLT